MFDEEINVALSDGESEMSRSDILKNIDTSMFSKEELDSQEQIVEAILFMMGDSVNVDVLATALSKDHDIALAAAERLVLKYENEYKDRGMKVIRINHKYQMVANNKYFQNLVLVASKPQKPVLTDAVLETLSIIAYKQPITKPEIEVIRGVKSDFAVNRLIEYGLVEEKGRLDAPGRPIILGTTEEFLLRFGLESTEDLPILPPTREAEIETEVEKELTESLGEPVHIDHDKDNIEENKENDKNENTDSNTDNDVVNDDSDKFEIKEDERDDANEDYEDEEELILEAEEDENEEVKEDSKKEFNEVDKNLMKRYQDENASISDNDIDLDIENTDSVVSHERQDTQRDETGESDDKEPQ